MSNLQESYINPFDNENLSFHVLQNQQGEYSLWPTQQPTPQGWQAQFGPDSRKACIAYVEKHWTSINPFQMHAGEE